MRNLHVRSLFVLAALLATACGGGTSREQQTPASNTSAPTASRANVSTDKNSYPVFPDADAGADLSVPAEQGGKGFKGEGWQTSMDFDLIGDPRAVKGGVLRDVMYSFPGTLRMAGPEWNTSTNYEINGLMYESLVGLHPTTLQFMPALATHWQIAPDKKTFRFRLDPNARFSDGTPVTSDDVVASWKFLTDKSLQDLFFYTEYNKLEQPVAESKYIVQIKAKTLDWKNFLTASGLRIFPAHILKDVNGAAYLRDYNFKLVPGTGPYIVNEGDIKKGASISIRRRPDYWAAKYRANVGLFNFDEIRLTVVRDQNLAFEMFKRGDRDYHYVAISQQWVQELNTPNFQRGLLVKQKVFNNYPQGTQWLAFNTRRQPWDDIRIRKAFTLLLNRDQLIKTLFFNEYVPLNSFYPGTEYENPNNPKNPYDPQQALALLAEAGWKDHDAQGRLTKNGQPLQVELLYDDKGGERWLTIYQNDLRKVGITMNLRLVSPETQFKMEMQRQFDLVYGAWGAGSVFPDPRPEYHSSTADIQNTNNITGIKDKRVDELCEAYDREFDAGKRVQILRDLDSALTNQYQYILQWYGPSQRIAYWNRFGTPRGTFSRVGDFSGSLSAGIPQMWWIDPDKSQKLDQALRDTSTKLETPPVEDRYWLDYSKTNKHDVATGTQ
ncbi:MAG TPA: extracellular solute-binding protein [Vicinamibacterales bacterium]|nr:extracellular solute-binding protein [Vicinamibacterales bacterium]